MALQILAKISFDVSRLAESIRTLDATQFHETYAQYAIGPCLSLVLANRSGNHRDSLADEPSASARPTEHGRNQLYLMELVSAWFRWEQVRTVRVLSSNPTGAILPHVAALERNEGFTRLHIVLRADETSFHSEGERLYRLEAGEVWQLEPDLAQSTGSFGKQPKLTLAVDFPSGIDLPKLFLDPSKCTPKAPKPLAKRLTLDADTKRSIFGLSRLLHPGNWNEVISILAKIHFFRQVPNTEMFDWLDEICHRSGDAALIDRARVLRAELLGQGSAKP